MKYPKEYAKKAFDLIDAAYFADIKDTDSVEVTALVTLAAFAIDAIAFNQKDVWGVTHEEAFYMIRDAITKPDLYDK